MTELKEFEVVNIVRKFAKKEHSAALAQLALRISAITNYWSKRQRGSLRESEVVVQRLVQQIGRQCRVGSQCSYRFKQSVEDQLEQNNKALEKAETENTEFAAALAAEKAYLAEAEKCLASLVASQAASKNSLWPRPQRKPRP